ncbi:NAD-binding protein [Faecalibaculum rodentium]|uniref:NAD-binding protein n=8 Tax=Faecalibaculum rodentium TaxID=1702221 RepID=UPI002582ED50|nr:NAD-binding protein [Faecalibaculum rodentium]
MNIVVAGVGKAGHALVRQLDAEGHDVTVIESKSQVLEQTPDYLDVIGLQGSGTDVDVLREAGAAKANLVIAATSTDEPDIVICLLGRGLGAQRTIARIRNPEFHKSSRLIKNDLGLSMLINPENAAASEIVRSLHYSSKVKVYLFAKGRMELAETRVGRESWLSGRKINEIAQRSMTSVQFCIIQRDQEVIIPGGETVIQEGDKLSVAAQRRSKSFCPVLAPEAPGPEGSHDCRGITHCGLSRHQAPGYEHCGKNHRKEPGQGTRSRPPFS